MLLAFRLRNFRSFAGEHTLNLVHSPHEKSEGMPNPEVVPALAVLGANASGKSNLLRAIERMFEMIRFPSTQGQLQYEPFLLGADKPGPTLFEVAVKFDGVRYDYGFEYNNTHIVAEWLYSSPRGRSRTLFERGLDDRDWYFGDSLAGQNQALADVTRDDSLFLATAALLNHRTLTALQGQLSGLVKSLNAEALPIIFQQTVDSLESDPTRLEIVAKFLKRSDLGVSALTIEKSPMSPAVAEATQQWIESIAAAGGIDESQYRSLTSTLRPRLSHTAADGREVPFPFYWESVGTRNLLGIMGPILDQLETGGVLVVDELDTSLHPRLVSEIVKLFVDPEKNKHQAQLILSTHDVTVMMNISGYGALQRDQIWLVEKDRHTGESDLYPIWRYKPRKGEVLSRNYLMGNYGALPRIDDTNYADMRWWRSEVHGAEAED